MSQDQSVNAHYEYRLWLLDQRIKALEAKFHVEHAIANGVIRGPVSSGEEFAAAVFLGVSVDKANAFLTAFAKGRGIV